IGSSFLPSDILAALLCAQMERFQEIMDHRLLVWNTYAEGLKELDKEGILRLTVVPEYAKHNGHMFNIILPNDEFRIKLGNRLREKGVNAPICYVPLHSAPMGRKLGYEPEKCPVTEEYGSRILRLPLFADMSKDDAMYVVNCLKESIREI
ncbi:MAG: DegT/DnrJ/EryC1/StrS family aminotransferase, partial [Erysipelotrichales bacterium]|nr:DegT/DnrJ/EryC1/StrS family aminotransferase [Erysipelotrichales bacterium]